MNQQTLKHNNLPLSVNLSHLVFVPLILPMKPGTCLLTTVSGKLSIQRSKIIIHTAPPSRTMTQMLGVRGSTWATTSQITLRSQETLTLYLNPKSQNNAIWIIIFIYQTSLTHINSRMWIMVIGDHTLLIYIDSWPI